MFCNSSYYVYLAEENILSIYEIDSLNLFKQEKFDCRISCLYCNELVVLGTQDGKVYVLKSSESAKIIKVFNSPITALFVSGSILGIGTESGSVCVLVIKGTDTIVLEEKTHLSPILGIVTNGLEIYISDMQNRIFSFPNQKNYDNFNTYICYKKYLFASESTMLYCKTKEAFAVYLEHSSKHRDPIEKFLFSKTGSVVFIKDWNSLSIYNFNTKEIINTFNFEGDFLYHEDKNRIIVKTVKGFKTIENVVDKNILGNPMTEVFFGELKIEEKVVWSQSESSDEVVNIKRKKGKNSKKISYKFIKGDSNEKESSIGLDKLLGDEITIKEDLIHQDTNPSSELKKLFEEEKESSEESEVYAKDQIKKQSVFERKQFMASSLKMNNIHLMCYNLIGYITSTKDEFFNLVEITYHDSERSAIKIKDTNFCSLGVLCDRAAILATSSTIHFYSDGIEWTHKSPEDINLIGISNNLFCAVYNKGVVRIYKHSGLEIFNCEFDFVESVFCEDFYVFVLSHDHIYRINCKEFYLDKFQVLPSVAWIYSHKDFYYKCKSSIYVVRNGLSIKLADNPNFSLCISNGYLVTLSETNRLCPEPSVEYISLKISNNSSCPNILNFTIINPNVSALQNILDQSRDSGRSILAKDLKEIITSISTLNGSDEINEKNPDRDNYFVQANRESWVDKDILSKDNINTRNEVSTSRKVKKYNPFKDK